MSLVCLCLYIQLVFATLGPVGKTCGIGPERHYFRQDPATQPPTQSPNFCRNPNFYPIPYPTPSQPQPNPNPTPTQPQPNSMLLESVFLDEHDIWIWDTIYSFSLLKVKHQIIDIAFSTILAYAHVGPCGCDQTQNYIMLKTKNYLPGTLEVSEKQCKCVLVRMSLVLHTWDIPWKSQAFPQADGRHSKF